MTLNTRTTHTQKQSYRLWFGAADQCTMAHGTNKHIMIWRMLNYTTESTLETRQETIIVSKQPTPTGSHQPLVCMPLRVYFNHQNAAITYGMYIINGIHGSEPRSVIDNISNSDKP